MRVPRGVLVNRAPELVVLDHAGGPEVEALADDLRQANYIDGSEVELVRELPKDIDIKHAIFDHDGTISTLREGWEHIMEPMMVRAILGERFEDAEESLYHKIVDQELIDNNILEGLRDGSIGAAKIATVERPLGYVLLRKVIRFFRVTFF